MLPEVPELRWPPVPASCALGPGAVHVCVTRLDVDDERRAALARLLAPDERARAASFLRPHLSHRYVAGRGQLRLWLSKYLATDPSALEFRYGRDGKPMLHATAGDAHLEFNVTHSGGVAVFAITRDARIGVDIESVVAFPEMRTIATSHFSAAELRVVSAESPERLPGAFFRCWTRKEAYLKAIGTGLMTPLDAFDVRVSDDEAPALTRVAGDPDAPRRWSLVHLSPCEGYVGAVAVECPSPVVQCWRFDTVG